MSGTQPTMADAPRSPLSPDPMSDCDKPSYGDLLAETDNYDSEDDKPLKRPESPTKHVEPHPTPSQLNKREAPEEWPEDEDKCEDEAKLKMPKAPRKPKTPKSKFKGKGAMKAKRSLKKGMDKAARRM